MSRIVPFSRAASEHVVSTAHGDYMSTWRLEGQSFEGLSADEGYARMTALNVFVRSLSNGKFAFWVHRVRRAITDGLTVAERPGFARDTLTKYYDKLSSGGLMTTELYLTVIYRPYPQRSDRLMGRIGSRADEVRLEVAAAVEVLEDVHRSVASSLGVYGPKRLGLYEEDRIKYSSQLEFYAYLLNGYWWRVPFKGMPLDKYLPVARILFGNELMETRDSYGSTWSTFVDIKDYADFTEPGILDGLLGLDCEYVETHSFSPLTTLDGQSALKRQRGQLVSAEDSARSQIAQIDQAIDELVSGSFSLGEYHYLMHVKGATPEAAKAARSQAIEKLQKTGSGFMAVPVDLVVDAAFASQLPGNWRMRPRTAKLSSRNFTGLCSLHNFTPGKRIGNPWGEAVTILKSPAGQPVYFNFHASPPGENSFGQPLLGNTQVIGKSRGGKTVLVLFLMMNMEKYGTQCVYFDKDRGAEIAIRAIGGKYLTLERGKPTGFNPWKCESTPRNLLFLADLVKACTRLNGQDHTPKEEAEISHAVSAVMQLPVEYRSFAAVVQNLPPTDANGIAQRLKKWCSDGPLGWALDSPTDELAFESGRTYGFDYTELLDDPPTRSAIMMYLMFRLEELIDGRRFMFVMDEYWKALSDPYFEDFARNKQKTIGKQNGFGVFITQSPSDTVRSPIARTLIEQSATMIFLPNGAADRDDYVEGFKLTEDEYQLVRSLPEHGRSFVIKQNDRVSVASLNLQGFDQELAILSGTTAGVARLDGLRKRLGDNPALWLTPFVQGES